MAPPPSPAALSRRGFLSFCASASMALIPGRHPASTWVTMCHAPRSGPRPHPAPRPGITAANVLTGEQLGAWADAIPAFDEVRQIPEIVDGIRCNCGCAEDPNFYSLLSCYEGEGMARYCKICQGQGRVAFRLHTAGKTLDEIRAAIDARFG
jgi:hypothetical protein